jgi:hypothetical protein
VVFADELGGSWSAFHPKNDIAKGFDVLCTDDRRTDGAESVRLRELNVRTQPDYDD